MSKFIKCFLFGLSVIIYTDIISQNNRPIPYPVFHSPQFEKAIANGTRTPSGEPGPNYWTNFSTYQIGAILSPEKNLLQGEVAITYKNNSPDKLEQLVINLYQNMNKEGQPRNIIANITGGVKLSKVIVNGRALVEKSDQSRFGYAVKTTKLYIPLQDPLRSGETAEIHIGYQFEIPEISNPRMGQDGEVFFLAYWYPQMAVYDDVHGWDEDPYLGAGEFYMGYADYEVQITVPEGWLVGATGELQNHEEVLTEKAISKLKQASISDETISIVDASDLMNGSATRRSANRQLTWSFKAENVRDFAFGSSNRYIWDASSAIVNQKTGQRCLIHSLYRPRAKNWDLATQFGKFSTEYLSDFLWPYNWSHMTMVEGLIGGGMEYPMITLIGGIRDEYSLMSVIIHEIGHMWFPMEVGSDEKGFTWLDEGLTRFNQNYGLAEYFPKVDPWDPVSSRVARYYEITDTGQEVEIMRHGDRYPYNSSVRGAVSYGKTAVGLRVLKTIFGEEKFMAAFRSYGKDWSYKHPTHFDFFNSLEQALGKDLDWFWTSWFYTTWTMDYSIQNLEIKRKSTNIFIEDRGLLPMPVLMEITYADGTKENKVIPVDEWLSGKKLSAVTVKSNKVVKVELDPGWGLPDIDRSNNIWIKE